VRCLSNIEDEGTIGGSEERIGEELRAASCEILFEKSRIDQQRQAIEREIFHSQVRLVSLSTLLRPLTFNRWYHLKIHWKMLIKLVMERD